MIVLSLACRSCNRGWTSESDPTNRGVCSKCGNEAHITGEYASTPVRQSPTQ